MAVDADTVRRIAHLARIAVVDEEIDHPKGERNAMLAFVEQLEEVNVNGVEPMTSVTPMAMKKRADAVTDGGIADAIVKNAPASEDNFVLICRNRRSLRVGVPGLDQRVSKLTAGLDQEETRKRDPRADCISRRARSVQRSRRAAAAAARSRRSCGRCADARATA